MIVQKPSSLQLACGGLCMPINNLQLPCTHHTLASNMCIFVSPSLNINQMCSKLQILIVQKSNSLQLMGGAIPQIPASEIHHWVYASQLASYVTSICKDDKLKQLCTELMPHTGYQLCTCYCLSAKALITLSLNSGQKGNQLTS